MNQEATGIVETVGTTPDAGLAQVQEVSQTQTGASSSPCVEIRGLRKSYGFKPILRSLDLTIEEGESLALLGANGVGKTTLLRILACLTRPDAGTCRVMGFDAVHEAQEVRRIVGVVAHASYLYEELTVLENLLFFGQMYNVASARERAINLLGRVGLERRQRERVATLSRGQVQRLSWARALLHAPCLLLLDEPDTGLDQEGHLLVDALLNEHRARGGTTLFTTHQPERALELASRVALLSGGRIVYQHPTQALSLDELRQTYRQVDRETKGRRR
jgi:heme ABC exporter ATP-binding subunit CcmA